MARREWEIRCAKHPDDLLGTVFTPRASALCHECNRFVSTEGKPVRRKLAPSALQNRGEIQR